MRIPKALERGIGLAIAACAFPSAASVLFSESFDDADLPRRNWYDGTEFRIVGDSWAGQGCIEHEWFGADSKPSGSSGIRHSFEATDGQGVCGRQSLEQMTWVWQRRSEPQLPLSGLLQRTG